MEKKTQDAPSSRGDRLFPQRQKDKLLLFIISADAIKEPNSAIGKSLIDSYQKTY
ncbi:hypothetical protein NCCP2716_15280 [Sporosarcina sp. NCCP-2716]|nr:hypothetical protein NCCP2716_15280 [Sporosarcina sp. NCCP-2716]